MHVYRAERGGEDRRSELPAEKLKGTVGLGIRAERVHIDADLLPFFIVARGGIAGIFAARARHRVAAGPAVADGTCFAVRADLRPGRIQDLIISHVIKPPVGNGSSVK